MKGFFGGVDTASDVSRLYDPHTGGGKLLWKRPETIPDEAESHRTTTKPGAIQPRSAIRAPKNAPTAASGRFSQPSQAGLRAEAMASNMPTSAGRTPSPSGT